ncbi:MAG: hypothetical protein KAX39_03095 [candidate division Zixibacteria bacterium]|nr:hypothetical protein [candidate division Zixibacteria bacterium]
MIDVINKLAGEAEVEIRRIVKESEDGQGLLSVPEIGFILAYLILVEIGDIFHSWVDVIIHPCVVNSVALMVAVWLNILIR